jgi:hypothetical protein
MEMEMFDAQRRHGGQTVKTFLYRLNFLSHGVQYKSRECKSAVKDFQAGDMK